MLNCIKSLENEVLERAEQTGFCYFISWIAEEKGKRLRKNFTGTKYE